MAIRMIEQRVCDEPGCGRIQWRTCNICDGDICGTHYTSMNTYVPENYFSKFLCLSCYRERFPEFTEEVSTHANA
jgi:hypothetical protein